METEDESRLKFLQKNNIKEYVKFEPATREYKKKVRRGVIDKDALDALGIELTTSDILLVFVTDYFGGRATFSEDGRVVTFVEYLD